MYVYIFKQKSFDAPISYEPNDKPSNSEFLNMAESSIRRLVKMAKNISIFKKLAQVRRTSVHN